MSSIASLSGHVQQVVEVERDVVAVRLGHLQQQALRLQELLSTLEQEVAENARLLRSMDEMLGVATQLPLDGLNEELRGQRLREFAVKVLRDHHGDQAAMHYREWYELLVEVGARIAGKDPVAAFLTQISRAPEVESVRPRSGLYRLREIV